MYALYVQCGTITDDVKANVHDFFCILEIHQKYIMQEQRFNKPYKALRKISHSVYIKTLAKKIKCILLQLRICSASVAQFQFSCGYLLIFLPLLCLYSFSFLRIKFFQWKFIKFFNFLNITLWSIVFDKLKVKPTNTTIASIA